VKLVKFSCDCIGTEPVDGLTVILRACDGEGNISFFQSNRCHEKSYRPLDSDEVRDIIEETSKLISNGYHFREMKRLMRRF